LWRALRCGLALLAAAWLVGCATSKRGEAMWPRPFVFGADTFSYPNELVWEYHIDDATGRTTHHRREPPATYAHRCFVVAKAARQFFQFAEFDPTLPRSDAASYRRQVRQVISKNPRAPRLDWAILFPGYTNLFQFSQDYQTLLKDECGSAWKSYFQAGHWRMILPFSSGHQETTAHALAASVRRNRPPVVHVLRFPSLAINHALLLHGVKETEHAIAFDAYDPNTPGRPTTLTFDRKTRRFTLPRNLYFAGGLVKVYEVYHELGY
jgi:hypothetical protein